MTWWLENPLPIVLLGITAVVVFGAIWLQSGRKLMMYLMLAAILLTVSGVLIERAVQTDREQVDATLHQLARYVEQNDLQSVLKHVDPSLTGVRARAATEMQRYDFSRVSIKQNLEITVFPDEDPPRAIAEFNVVVVITDRSGTLNAQRVPRFVRLEFKKENGDWVVTDFEHFSPDVGFKRRTQK